jgi:hypothetical protein
MMEFSQRQPILLKTHFYWTIYGPAYKIMFKGPEIAISVFLEKY